MRNKKLIISLIVVCSLALIIVLNSVIFSVQNVTSYCMNDDDEALAQSVIDNCGIKKGGSIFTLKESDVADNVTQNIPYVKVVNIEKMFPNKVSINFVRVFPYLRLEREGKYYFCGNDGTILYVSDQKYPVGEKAKALGFTDNGDSIELRLSTSVDELKEGDKFTSASSVELLLVTELLSALERLSIYGEAVEIIDFIDVSKSQHIFIGMHSGVKIELIGGSNVTQKLRAAYSFYSSTDDEKRQGGTIIIPDGDGSGGSYSKDDRYAASGANKE